MDDDETQLSTATDSDSNIIKRPPSPSRSTPMKGRGVKRKVQEISDEACEQQSIEAAGGYLAVQTRKSFMTAKPELTYCFRAIVSECATRRSEDPWKQKFPKKPSGRTLIKHMKFGESDHPCTKCHAMRPADYARECFRSYDFIFLT